MCRHRLAARRRRLPRPVSTGSCYGFLFSIPWQGEEGGERHLDRASPGRPNRASQGGMTDGRSETGCIHGFTRGAGPTLRVTPPHPWPDAARYMGVHRHGELGRDPPSRPRRRPEQARRLPRVRHPLGHAHQDPRPPRAARLPPHGPRPKPKLDPFLPRHPPDPRGRQEGPQEAAAHRQPHLRAAPRRARLPRRPDRRQGGRRRLAAPVRRGLRPAGPPARRGPGRLRRGRGHPRRPARQGGAVRHDPAVLRRHLRAAPSRASAPRRSSRATSAPSPSSAASRGGSATTTSRIAVAKITGGRDREVTDEFLRLKSHHLFEAHFCLVRRPNEKGHVETLVGYARRTFLVPVPVVHGGLEPLNAAARGPLPRGPGPAALGQAGDQGGPARRGAGGLPAAAGRGVRGRPGRAAGASTRCRWSASTPTSTRCRPSSPTTGSRSSPAVDDVRIVVGDRGRGATAGAGAASRCSTSRCTTWPCWSASPGRWTSRRPWRAGSCRSASASCGGGWRPSSAGRGRGSSSRSCGSWSGRASEELTRAVERGPGAGRRRRRRGAADPGAPAGAAGRACSASTAGRT